LLLILLNLYALANAMLKRMAVVLPLCLCASLATAEPYNFGSYNFFHSGDDTILVEKEGAQKIPYGRIAKALVDRFFQVDVKHIFSGGKNRKTASARNFSDYADRTKYRVAVKKEQVQLKFSLNF
jgi:hypothetical protein